MTREKWMFLVGGLVAIPAVFLVIDHLPHDVANANSRSTAAKSANTETAKRDLQQQTTSPHLEISRTESTSPQQEEPGDDGRDLSRQIHSVMPVTAVEYPPSDSSVPTMAASVSGSPDMVPSIAPEIFEQLHRYAEGMTFVIRLQRAHGDSAHPPVPFDMYGPDSFIPTPQVDAVNLPPIDATLFCNGFEIASDGEINSKEQVPEADNHSQTWPSPPTNSIIEHDETETLASPPSPSLEDADQSVLADAQNDALPETNTQSVAPVAEHEEKPDSGKPDIRFVCHGEVSLVFRTSFIKAAQLSYADDKFQFVDAVVSTPFGEFTAPTLTLKFPLDGLHIQRVSKEANLAPTFDGADIPPAFFVPPLSLPAHPSAHRSS